MGCLVGGLQSGEQGVCSDLFAERQHSDALIVPEANGLADAATHTVLQCSAASAGHIAEATALCKPQI